MRHVSKLCSIASKLAGSTKLSSFLEYVCIELIYVFTYCHNPMAMLLIRPYIIRIALPWQVLTIVWERFYFQTATSTHSILEMFVPFHYYNSLGACCIQCTHKTKQELYNCNANMYIQKSVLVPFMVPKLLLGYNIKSQ